jgi:hypothetical protein
MHSIREKAAKDIAILLRVVEIHSNRRVNRHPINRVDASKQKSEQIPISIDHIIDIYKKLATY